MEIGDRLKEAREAKGLSLDDVQQETKIQKRYLQAIETGNFSIMPGKFYTRAFIRQYAEAVGLDPDEVMEEHKGELPSSGDEEYVQYSRAERQREQQSDKTSVFASAFPKLIVGALLIGVVVLIAFFVINGTGNGDANETNEAETSDGGEPISINESDEEEAEEATAEGQEDESKNENEEKKAEKAEDEAASDQEKSDEESEQTDKEDTPSEEEKSAEEESKPEIKLVQQGSENAPTHTFEVTGVNDELKVEIQSANTYLNVENLDGKSFYADAFPKQGESDTKTFDLSGEKGVYLNVGRTVDTTIKINGVELQYPVKPADKPHQKFEIKVKESSQ
ncbi:hypothetical protein N781_11860 [Pontibacillus halophilus JSM 076056 = DSM 19796]|uniref:HTH cro/C1-type domain-containing protein n=1 Tax=Pontibacillus halophilus JSM 076056 = DSM 19796 TaxID=1385510 RepID=A0A0A5GPZ7_9BACI|nr:helix-turn-helix domain-containing protein [Pontibacillus halophilus]KGX93323.1 hypothetical protein N781_11860 [Pontibacillus halophilus JSM 076056 = DSM 19796]